MIMGYEEKIRLLLSMQEHPEQYSDEQLRQMFADDQELAGFLEQLALTKQAFVKREADKEVIHIDEEWQKFHVEHSAELDTFGEGSDNEPQSAHAWRIMGVIPYKFAANFIGILFVVGVAFAAVHIMHVSNNSKQQPAQTEQPVSAKPDNVLPQDTVHKDTTATVQPIVFDNVPLEEMLTQIAAHYNKEVVFQNSDARQLRFYFVWKPEEGLDVTLHRLNLFESITVKLTDNKIVLE